MNAPAPARVVPSRLVMALALLVVVLSLLGLLSVVPFGSTVVFALFVLVGVCLLAPWAWP